MLINTADPLWPRVRIALTASQPSLDGLTADQYASNVIMSFIKRAVITYESHEAFKPAQEVITAAVAKVESDFDEQIAKLKT